MQGSIALYPRLRKSKYKAYLEAWDLLRAAVVDRIEACAEEWWTVAAVSAAENGQLL